MKFTLEQLNKYFADPAHIKNRTYKLEKSLNHAQGKFSIVTVLENGITIHSFNAFTVQDYKLINPCPDESHEPAPLYIDGVDELQVYHPLYEKFYNLLDPDDVTALIYELSLPPSSECLSQEEFCKELGLMQYLEFDNDASLYPDFEDPQSFDLYSDVGPDLRFKGRVISSFVHEPLEHEQTCIKFQIFQSLSGKYVAYRVNTPADDDSVDNDYPLFAKAKICSCLVDVFEFFKDDFMYHEQIFQGKDLMPFSGKFNVLYITAPEMSIIGKKLYLQEPKITIEKTIFENVYDLFITYHLVDEVFLSFKYELRVASKQQLLLIKKEQDVDNYFLHGVKRTEPAYSLGDFVYDVHVTIPGFPEKEAGEVIEHVSVNPQFSMTTVFEEYFDVSSVARDLLVKWAKAQSQYQDFIIDFGFDNQGKILKTEYEDYMFNSDGYD